MCLDHQSSCCGGMLAVEGMVMFGSTRTSARSLRCPGFVGSCSVNGDTRCCSTFGKTRRRSSRVETWPTIWFAGNAIWGSGVSTQVFRQIVSRGSYVVSVVCIVQSADLGYAIGFVLFGKRAFWEVELGIAVGGQELLVDVLAKSQVRLGDIGAIVVVECAGTDVFVGQALA
jgi:hypothetical protein